jgi:hypothetical protein
VNQREPIRTHTPGPGLSHRIPVSPAAIRSLVDAGSRLGVAYGCTYEQIIAEDTINGHQLQVYLRQDVEGWTLIVRGALPPDAIVSFHAGHYSRHATFNAEEEVQFSIIPEAWLRMDIDLVVVLPAADST